jgi:hypothetical protein
MAIIARIREAMTRSMTIHHTTISYRKEGRRRWL